MGREFLQLAEPYKAKPKQLLAGRWLSEKLDGTRAFWDGGISRGLPTESVPYASVLDPKTGKRKAKIKPVATGLWSRYGNPIMAPDWFLNSLPCMLLDGELWAGRGNFQLCRSICAGDEPDPRFNKIKYATYSSPSLEAVFGGGTIKNANMLVNMDGCLKWVEAQARKLFGEDWKALPDGSTFEDELKFLAAFVEADGDNLFVHRQVKLPSDEAEARKTVEAQLEKLLEDGGEGLVMRDGSSRYTPKRHAGVFKHKPHEDSEATITGFVTGREGKQGNCLGKIGTLQVSWVNPDKKANPQKKAVEFELGTGLKMFEREFAKPKDKKWATEHPETFTNDCLPAQEYLRIGSVVTFKYRELSDDGIPKEGRYWRPRPGEE